MVQGGTDARRAQGGRGAGRKPVHRALGPKQPAQKKKGGKLTSVKNQIRAVKRLLQKVSWSFA